MKARAAARRTSAAAHEEDRHGQAISGRLPDGGRTRASFEDDARRRLAPPPGGAGARRTTFSTSMSVVHDGAQATTNPPDMVLIWRHQIETTRGHQDSDRIR